MSEMVKCSHCYYLDYLDEEPKQCPKCGSKTTKLENPFENEVIQVKITTTRRNKRKVDITFDSMARSIDGLVSNPIVGAISNVAIRSRLVFMIKAYTWLLLKLQPQLWLNIDVVVSGITELMILKLKKGE